MLQRSLQEPRLLTQLSDVRSVVVSEHLVTQDSVRHVRVRKEVQFQETGLEGSLSGSVVLESV